MWNLPEERNKLMEIRKKRLTPVFMAKTANKGIDNRTKIFLNATFLRCWCHHGFCTKKSILVQIGIQSYLGRQIKINHRKVL